MERDHGVVAADTATHPAVTVEIILVGEFIFTIYVKNHFSQRAFKFFVEQPAFVVNIKPRSF